MDWYQHSGYPAQSANGDSASARSEFDAIALDGTKMPALTGSALRIVRVNAAGTALESVTTATATLETYASVQAGTQIGLAAAKTTPVDADVFPALDSAAANILTKFTWANIKATMYNTFGVLLAAGTGKTTPTGADSLAISDSAAAGATKTLTFTDLVTYLAGLCSAGWNADTATLATTATNLSGTPTFFAPITNSLSSDVYITSSAYFTGPSVAQGTSGKWFASGSVAVTNSYASHWAVKLWDGATVIARAALYTPASQTSSIAVSGFIASPAGNIRISVAELSTGLGGILADVYGTGDNKDSTLTAIRVG